MSEERITSKATDGKSAIESGKRMSLQVWIMLLSGVLLNAVAQLMIRGGTLRLGVLWPADQSVFANLLRIVFEPVILGALLCYVVSVGLWVIVLSQVPVSVAYPMLSIGYVVNAVLAYFLFQETLTLMQFGGIAAIILGVILLNRG